MNISAILSLHSELSLIAIILIILVADLFMGSLRRRWLHPLVCVLMLVHTIINIDPDFRSLFGGMYINTHLISVAKSILSAGTMLVFLMSGPWIGSDSMRVRRGEFYVLTLCTLLGMFFMLTAGHMMLFYIGLELAGIPMACLAALEKGRRAGAEAGAKYILTSAFSSGLLLYGLSLLYGSCGTLYIGELMQSVTGNTLEMLSMILLIAGMGMKMSLVPFHLWTADVYQGAPTPVTLYLSIISKGAGAIAMWIILHSVYSNMSEQWSIVISILCVTTITIGNLMALLQSDMKRFMAFSSVSQAGYLLMGMAGNGLEGLYSLMFYLAVYVFSNVAIFGIISQMEMCHGRNITLADFKGFYSRYPMQSIVMTISLFSLGGLPPLGGFFSKYAVYYSAFHAGWTVIVFIALVNTVISLYYYLRVVKAMYIDKEEICSTTDSNNSVVNGITEMFRHIGILPKLGLTICAVALCVLGLWSGFFEWLCGIN